MAEEASSGDVWLLQEHKLVDRKAIGKIKAKLQSEGWHGTFSNRIFAERLGKSRGTAVLTNSHVSVLSRLAVKHQQHRATGVLL